MVQNDIPKGGVWETFLDEKVAGGCLGVFFLGPAIAQKLRPDIDTAVDELCRTPPETEKGIALRQLILRRIVKGRAFKVSPAAEAHGDTFAQGQGQSPGL